MNDESSLGALLEKRARHLARPSAPQRPIADTAALVAFDVGRERCLLPAAAIAEVLPAPRPSPVPGAPAWAEGIVAARGQMLPLARVDRLIGGAGAGGADVSAGPGVCLVLADAPIALLADRVVGTQARPDIAPAALPAAWSPAARHVTAGMLGERLLIDVHRLIQQLTTNHNEGGGSASFGEQGDPNHALHR